MMGFPDEREREIEGPRDQVGTALALPAVVAVGGELTSRPGSFVDGHQAGDPRHREKERN